MMDETIKSIDADQHPEALRLKDWLWRPWYAKLWWSGVPVYWLGKLAALKLDALDGVYRSAAGGYLNIFFFPPILALILSFGFVRKWLASLTPIENDEFDEDDFWDRRKYGLSGVPKEIDPLDPASGALWIGSSLNPLNPGYINRAS